jgi:ABC-type nitrate/sulfonate/bicarbonate transport system permease component
VLSGGVVGFLLGSSRLARAAFEPTLNALYTVPKLALLPLLLLIFGIGEEPKIILIAMTVFFFMWISTMEAVATLSEGYGEAARSFRAGWWTRFRHVTFPAVLPQIFVAMRVSAGVAVLVLVGAEFVQGGNGIGYLIWNSWSLFLADRMYVGITVVALMGVVFSAVIAAVGRAVMPWNSQSRARKRKDRSLPVAALDTVPKQI